MVVLEAPGMADHILHCPGLLYIHPALSSSRMLISTTQVGVHQLIAYELSYCQCRRSTASVNHLLLAQASPTASTDCQRKSSPSASVGVHLMPVQEIIYSQCRGSPTVGQICHRLLPVTHKGIRARAGACTFIVVSLNLEHWVVPWGCRSQQE